MAEGASHGAVSDSNRKVAFTLAEVLITLGIIGVVAAMTLPALIQNYKKQVVETRMKKFYSNINQAIQFSENDNGDKKYWTPANVDEFWDKYLKNYLKYTKVRDIEFVRPRKIIYFADGSGTIIDIYYTQDSNGNILSKTTGGHFIFCPEIKYCNWYAEYGDADIMGSKVFSFGFWPNTEGNLWKYHYNKGVEPYKYNWNGDINDLVRRCKNETQYCTSVIQFNDWKVPDNYPHKL